jgi:uncharacterized protein involved in response to NO
MELAPRANEAGRRHGRSEGRRDMPRTGTAAAARAWTGGAFLSHGFRPFFLGGAIWAAVAMALWLGMLTGRVSLPTRMGPVDWHVHALVFGFLPAVVAGFLLTAIPNWTGRLPVVGWGLLALFGLWCAGRAAILVGGRLPPGLAEAIDLAFLLVVAGVAAREIVAGRNWRNLVVLAAVALLWIGNLVFHLDAAQGAAGAGPGARVGIAAGVFLVLLIGGRIVPSFTRNWLARQTPGRLPAPFDRLDAVALGLAAAALALWVAAPGAPAAAAACLLAGLAHFARLARWAGWRTGREPLVTILHVGYAFAPVGFLAMGAAIFLPGLLGVSAAVHAWTAGLIGVMTLAVMTRASLGHSGRALTAGSGTTAIYACVVLAAVARVADGIAGAPAGLLHLSAALWILAFGGFAVLYWPVLTRPRAAARRPQPKPGG